MEVTKAYNQSIPISEGSEEGFNISLNSSTVIDVSGPVVSDKWVNVVLIFMTLSCAGCLCSCLIYYKCRKWKVPNLGEETDSNNGDLERRPSKEDPPSYTMVTGLPSYDQAIKQALSSPAYTISGSDTSSSPIPFDFLQEDETRMSISMIVEINTTKGVYPNPPLTPPTVSPSRVPTGSADRPLNDVHHIKI